MSAPDLETPSLLPGQLALLPQRIQARRVKGWRKPEGAVYVGRPSRWGNPYRVVLVGRRGPWEVWLDGLLIGRHTDIESARADAVDSFRLAIDPAAPRDSLPTYPLWRDIERDLAGKDLACWCPLDQPCHADVLLQIANEGMTR